MLSKVVIAFNDALQDTAPKTPILILGRCRSVNFDGPKTYQIVQKMAPFDLIYEAVYPDNTTFFFNVCNSIKMRRLKNKCNFLRSVNPISYLIYTFGALCQNMDFDRSKICLNFL